MIHWNRLKSSFRTIFFFSVVGGGGGGGNGFIKSILISSTSNTVSDADFADKTITLMYITVDRENGGSWISSGFTQTADTIDNTNNGGFESGSLVFFFGE